MDVKQKRVVVVGNPSLNPLDNAAGVAPHPAAPPKRVEKHYNEVWKIRAEKTKLDAEVKQKIHECDILIGYFAGKQQVLPAYIEKMI